MHGARTPSHEKLGNGVKPGGLNYSAAHTNSSPYTMYMAETEARLLANTHYTNRILRLVCTCFNGNFYLWPGLMPLDSMCYEQTPWPWLPFRSLLMLWLVLLVWYTSTGPGRACRITRHWYLAASWWLILLLWSTQWWLCWATYLSHLTYSLCIIC